MIEVIAVYQLYPHSIIRFIFLLLVVVVVFISSSQVATFVDIIVCYFSPVPNIATLDLSLEVKLSRKVQEGCCAVRGCLLGSIHDPPRYLPAEGTVAPWLVWDSLHQPS